VVEVVPKVVEVVMKAVEVALYMLEIVNGVRCVRGIMLCMLFCILFRMLFCKCWKLCSMCWRPSRTCGMCCRCGDVL